MFSRHRPITNVGAIVRVAPADLVHRGIGLALCGADRVPQGGHTQYPSAIGDHLPVLLFGAGVATVMALLIIPLGCISARKQFYVETSDDGHVKVSAAYEMIEHEAIANAPASGGPSPIHHKK